MEPFTAVFEQDGDWRIGYVEELPRSERSMSPVSGPLHVSQAESS